MLGIRLGMAIAEAEDLVREHMAIGATFASSGSGDHEARLFVADHIGEMIALHADPQDGTTVAGAWRVLLFRDDAPEPPLVAGRLEDKYGVPDWINPAGTGWAWGEGAQASLCRARRTAELTLEAAEIRSGALMEHVIDLLQAYRPVLALPEPALEEGDYAHCGPMVEARLETDGLLTFLLDHRASAGAPDPAGSARPSDAVATLLDLKL
jgi:hypothetical protein